MKFLLGILIMIFLGCTTSYKNQSLSETFSLIKLGDAPGKVVSLVGEPQQKNEKSVESKWYYFNYRKILKSEISFSESKKVQSLIVYPQPEGKEDQLDTVMNVTFKGLSFTNLKKLNCQKDYYFSNEFYINKENRVVILHNMRRNSVVYYSYQSLEDINDLENAFNKCLLKNW